MLLTFLSHLLALDFAWIVFDLILGFAVLTVSYLILSHIYSEGKNWLRYFFFLMLLLYALLDFGGLTGITLISGNHMLEWLMFQFTATIFLAGTSLQKHTLKIMVGSFLGFSLLFG
ncbi:MAG: hypothetical protein WC634_00625 [archaeon]